MQPQRRSALPQSTLKHSGAIEHTLVQRCCRAHANNCIASELLPGEEWEKGQMTPLCSRCDRERGACHFVLERAGLDHQHGQSKDGQWSHGPHSSTVVP